jgi:hypothetical protein
MGRSLEAAFVFATVASNAGQRQAKRLVVHLSDDVEEIHPAISGDTLQWAAILPFACSYVKH